MSVSNGVQTELITLSRQVLNEQYKFKEASGDLTLLLVSIQLGCKFVSSQVRKAGLVQLTGLSSNNAVNVQGEDVKKLDEVSNSIFINALKSSGKVAVMVSEENENEIIVEGPLKGKYCVVFDPLDGSSNIDCAISIGTIFGIYKLQDGDKGDSVKSVLRPGREMVAAGYCLYGSTTMLMLATKNSASGDGISGATLNGYTLDTSIGEFILTHPKVQIPKRGKIYSVNEGNSVYWDDACKKYFSSLKNPADPNAKPYSARYVGSMVADVHRTILYGGIFAYPADSKSKNGKLRLLYECFPMAFIVEAAGGLAITGKSGEQILNLIPKSIHDRAPIFLGSRDDVTDLATCYKSVSN
ncbi:hypothetical protein MIR68_001917 [Amoeboaphelidium protococcarum]|nr:hypothetical protein MIR68_001917 [Amoeboaphelidium protococcarum]